MSRNLIVGLAVLIVAALAWIVIGRMAGPDLDAQAPAAPEEVVVVDAPVVVETDGAEVETTAAGATDRAEENLAETVEENNADAAAAVDAPAIDADLAAPTVPATDAAAAPVITRTETTVPLTVVPAPGADATAIPADGATPTAGTVDATGNATDGTQLGTSSTVTVVNTPPTAPGVDAQTGTIEIPDASATLPAADMAALTLLLTPETFDADAILGYVEQADTDPVARNGMVTAIEQAADNPQFVDAAILAVKTRFGIE